MRVLIYGWYIVLLMKSLIVEERIDSNTPLSKVVASHHKCKLYIYNKFIHVTRLIYI